MAKKTRKPTNKAKFSLYLDKTVMAKIAKEADKEERSVNFLVDRTLAEKYI